MYYINRLPLLFALFAAILTGIVGLSRSTSNDRILVQMMITMVIFYTVGFFVRYNIMKIYSQVKEKKETEALEALSKNENDRPGSPNEQKENNDDDFEPLKAAKFVKRELKK